MFCLLKKVLVVVLICWGAAPLFGVPKTPTEAEPNRISVSQLLDKFSASYDKASKIRSYIVRWEELISGDCSFFGSSFRKTYESCERITDGERFFYCEKKWGHCLQGENLFISKNDAEMRTWLWDGQVRFEYQRHPAEGDPIGTVTIYQKPSEKQIEGFINYKCCGHEIFGFLIGEYERVDKVLRKTANISVRDKLEQIGSSNCYVIDAMTQGGKYTLWIDPQHGYNIAKAIVRWGENVPPYGQAHWRVKNALNSVENVSFGKIKNLWVPVEADIVLNRNWHNGEWTKQSWHHKLTEVILDPDHDALGSFVPDDIKNGAEVRIVTADGTLHYKEKYTWQDGKVVDGKGGMILDTETKNLPEK